MCGLQVLVDARHGDVLGHQVSQFAPNGNRVFGALLADQLLILFFLTLAFRFVYRLRGSLGALFKILHVLDGRSSGKATAKNARDQRVGTETVRTVILILAFAGGKNSEIGRASCRERGERTVVRD